MVPNRSFALKTLLTVFVVLAPCGNALGAIGPRQRIDSTGAVVPGAKVSVIDTAPNETSTLETNGSGDYTVPDVAAGTYEVRVEKEGFSQADVKNVIVNAQESTRVDIALQIGQSRQVVEVQATSVQVNSEDSRTTVTIA